MTQEWNIGGRGRKCAKTGRPFEDGEWFYTLLYRDRSGFRREDLSQAAFAERNDNIQPFSFWRGKFEAPTPGAPETVPRQSAEEMLREFTMEDRPEHRNARYVLAVMLERKRQLRHVDTKQGDDGPLLIYENIKTGEIFFVPDPELHLHQLEPVQEEVATLLAGHRGATPEQAPTPTEASSEPAPAADA